MARAENEDVDWNRNLLSNPDEFPARRDEEGVGGGENLRRSPRNRRMVCADAPTITTPKPHLRLVAPKRPREGFGTNPPPSPRKGSRALSARVRAQEI